MIFINGFRRTNVGDVLQNIDNSLDAVYLLALGGKAVGRV